MRLSPAIECDIICKLTQDAPCNRRALFDEFGRLFDIFEFLDQNIHLANSLISFTVHTSGRLDDGI